MHATVLLMSVRCWMQITELGVESENNVVYKIIYHFELRTLKPKCAQIGRISAAAVAALVADVGPSHFYRSFCWRSFRIFDLRSIWTMFTLLTWVPLCGFLFSPSRTTRVRVCARASNLFSFFSRSTDTFAHFTRETSDIHD